LHIPTTRRRFARKSARSLSSEDAKQETQRKSGVSPEIHGVSFVLLAAAFCKSPLLHVAAPCPFFVGEKRLKDDFFRFALRMSEASCFMRVLLCCGREQVAFKHFRGLVLQEQARPLHPPAITRQKHWQ
jgi:hypothetical protein